MEKTGTKTIKVNSWTKLDFDVYSCNCKIGDTVWFDDGIPNENGVITNHEYMRGKVTKIEPNKWRVYDDGLKELGYVTVKIDDGNFYAGQKFSVAFKDIIYEEPIEVTISDSQKLLDSCKPFEAEITEMNNILSFF